MIINKNYKKMNYKKVLCGLAVLCSFGNLANAEEIKKEDSNISNDTKYIEENNREYDSEIKSEQVYEGDIESAESNKQKNIIQDDKKVKFEEILEFTFENNDILNAERQKTKAVETLKFKTIGENALPEVGIDLNYGYTDFKQTLGTEPMKFRLNDDGSLENNKIYLQQPLFKSGRTVTKIKAVNNQILAQKNQLSQKEQEVLFDTIQATVNLLQSKEILKITIKNEESLKNSYEYIKAKKKVGRATSSDVSLAEARYSSAKSDTIMASTDYLNAKAIFLKITKIDPDVIDVDYEYLFRNSFDYSIGYDKVLETALQKNPQYQSAKNNYEMSRNNLSFAKTDFLPELFLNAQWGREKTTDVSSQTAGSVSLNLKVPLFQSGVEYASHKEAGYKVNEAKFTLNDVKDTLMQQTMTTYDEFLSSKSLIVSSKAYRDAAKITLDSTIAEEKVGKSTLVDVLDRRREYFDTEISFLKNKTNVITYYYTIRLLMGELNLVDLFIY